MLDIDELSKCEKFQPSVTSIFAKKKAKTIKRFFSAILHILLFGLSKLPQNSDLTWSVQHNLRVPDLFYLIIFLQALSVP